MPQLLQHDEEVVLTIQPEVVSPEVVNIPATGTDILDAKETLKESEELVVHFVSSPEKFEDPAKKNYK